MPLRDGGNPEPAGVTVGAGCIAGGYSRRRWDHGGSGVGVPGAPSGGAGGERGVSARRDPPRRLVAMSGSAAAAGVLTAWRSGVNGALW